MHGGDADEISIKLERVPGQKQVFVCHFPGGTEKGCDLTVPSKKPRLPGYDLRNRRNYSIRLAGIKLVTDPLSPMV